MRPLTDEETKTFFEKLSKYEAIMRQATSIGRTNLISLGICFGKFTKSGKFRLHITALPYLAQYATYKIWIKPNGEMSFLYGNNVAKAHVKRATDDTPEHQGVVIYNSNDIPLGFGVTARSTVDTRKLDPSAIVVFHQSDVGEYLRDEDTLF
ncbi:ribosome biosynthesis protein nip7 [Mycoemilia scoparia]|uniref:Ribosome biosynthesis protein nip7 n=1 Tax=Mycoemilia scoparia TaxID=417184 RepID=A0A9W8DRH0_9FUNG|nr:ribosome biosynthesis protein nip7 [Mycoemilia scoparia]